MSLSSRLQLNINLFFLYKYYNVINISETCISKLKTKNDAYKAHFLQQATFSIF